MQGAITMYQKRHGLKATGVLDTKTLRMIEQPRCGNPDAAPSGAMSPVAAFEAIGCKYQGNDPEVTFAILNTTGDIDSEDAKAAIRRALATWSAVAKIRFREVAATGFNAKLKFSWHSNDHGDGYPFDGAGRVLAHAFYPPTCGGTHAGKCHFDEDERWRIGTTGGAIDLESVALHEIGHLLGLNHSTVPESVMFASYAGRRRSLSPDDIAGIQSIYGART